MLPLFIGVVCIIPGALIGGWIGAIIVVLLTAICVLLPLEGYEPREEIEKIPLLKLKKYSTHGVCRYVEKKKNNATFAFDNRETYDILFEAYEEKSIHGRIKVYESEECETPVLRIFKSVPNRVMFTFAPFPKIEYVFLLPKGTLECKNGKNEQSGINVV